MKLVSVRLTNIMKDSIRNDIIKHKFPLTKQQKFKARWDKLRLDVMNSLLSEKDIKLIASLPKDWMPEYNYFNVSFGGQRHCFHLEKYHRLPKFFNNTIQIGARESLSIEFTQLARDEADYQEQIDQAKTKINAVFSQATTLAKLEALWPEAEPFLKKHRQYEGARPTAGLPMVQMNEINKLLELPPDDKKEVA